MLPRLYYQHGGKTDAYAVVPSVDSEQWQQLLLNCLPYSYQPERREGKGVSTECRREKPMDEGLNRLEKLPEEAGIHQESYMMGANLDKWRKNERCAQTTNIYPTSLLFFYLNKKNSNVIPGTCIPT